MQVYSVSYKMPFKQQLLTGRTSFEFVNKIMALFIEVTIWSAYIMGVSEVSTSVGAVSLRDMVTYAIRYSTGLSYLLPT